MSTKIVPLAHKITNRLQVIVGAMELGEYSMAATHAENLCVLCHELREEAKLMLEEHRKNLILQETVGGKTLKEMKHDKTKAGPSSQ